MGVLVTRLDRRHYTELHIKIVPWRTTARQLSLLLHTSGRCGFAGQFSTGIFVLMMACFRRRTLPFHGIWVSSSTGRSSLGSDQLSIGRFWRLLARVSFDVGLRFFTGINVNASRLWCTSKEVLKLSPITGGKWQIGSKCKPLLFGAFDESDLGANFSSSFFPKSLSVSIAIGPSYYSFVIERGGSRRPKATRNHYHKKPFLVGKPSASRPTTTIKSWTSNSFVWDCSCHEFYSDSVTIIEMVDFVFIIKCWR